MIGGRSWRSVPSVFGIALITLSVVTLFGLVLSDPDAVLRSPNPPATAGMVLRVEIGDEPSFEAPVPVFAVASSGVTTAALNHQFELTDYQLAAVRSGALEVPRLFVAVLPQDLSAVESLAARKQLFLQAALPLILRVNETVLAKRERLTAILERMAAGLELTAGERAWIEDLAERYETAPGDLEALLRRVDIVPPSLALAQAAIESGWGTSRFAREGNALFGERIFAEGEGLIPRDRDPDGNHEVRAFPRLIDSVAAYVHNLNTHEPYAKFRAMRAALRHAGRELQGYALVGSLRPYSEDGGEYLETIRRVMRGNELWQFDEARLSELEIAGLDTRLR